MFLYVRVHDWSEVEIFTVPEQVDDENLREKRREERMSAGQKHVEYTVCIWSQSNFHKFQPFNATLPKNTPKQPRTHEDLMLGPQ